MGETVSSAFKSDHLKTSSCEAERHRGFPSGSVVKTLPATQEMQADVLHPPVRKIPWRRTWQPTPVFLPGESHGQRSLAGYSKWGCKESDRTERAGGMAEVRRRACWKRTRFTKTACEWREFLRVEK